MKVNRKGRCAGSLLSVFRKRSEVREQKHVITEMSEGSGVEGHRGLSWVFVVLLLSMTGDRLLSWKLCHPVAKPRLAT